MKPEWCPEDVWETALSVCEPINPNTILHDLIAENAARALLAAEQRGRKAGLEDVSETIKEYRDFDGSTGAEWDDGYEAAYADIAAAIRFKAQEVKT